MSQIPHKGKRIRRHEHPSRLLQDTGHRRYEARAVTDHTERHSSSTGFHVRPSSHGHAKLAAVASDSPTTTSFDMLSVEPSPTSTQSSSELQSTQRSSSQALNSESTARVGASSSSEVFSVSTFSTALESISKESETSTGLEKPQRLQAELTTSIERTTLIVPATFSLPLSTSTALVGTTSALNAVTAARPTTWTRPNPTVTHRPSTSASSSPIVHPPMSHPHISPALIVFMVIGGFGALGLSLYVFRRVRYRALHVSRSQFQITSPSGRGGSGGVSGSESNKSFVSGGLGRLGQSNKQKNKVDAGNETPLWGGREKFSPQLGYDVDLPPAAHLNERIPANRRQSLMDTFRRNVPGRLSKYGPGWNAIPDAPTVPTVRITDVDTNHHRGASGSTFSESPDPNLASIQVASVTRTLSATASYRGSPSPRPVTILEHPRPAPRAPPKAALKAPPKVEIHDWIPPVPKIPDIPGLTTHQAGQKKHMDMGGRGKIAVTDISKPRPVVTANSSQTAGEADPMAMYAKYSAGLGVRDGSPEPIRRETSMAKKIAQIASSSTRPAIAPTVSQTSLSSRDTRALAAAAGVASPTPSEDRTLSRNDKHLPGTPGLGEVGNVMLRPFGQSGSMIPAHLETPAIGLDGRSSYLSTNSGAEAGCRDRASSNGGQGPGPLYAITAKPTTATSENDIPTLTASLHPSATDDSDQRTIMSAYSQDFMPLSQQAHMHLNPDYRSPTYSIYNYYGPDRISRSMINGEREPEIGGAM